MGEDPTGVYDRLGAGYDRAAALLAATGVPRMRAELLATATGEVLDIAAGTGINLRHYPQGIRITGVDLSAEALAAARVKAGEHGIRWTGLRADAAALPVADGSIDTAVITLAACTFADPGHVFAEVRRVLRPDGRLLLLEHVRPAGRIGPAVMRAITPLTVRALGCHPDRRTVVTLEAAGFATQIVARAMRGVFVAVVGTAR